MNVVGMEDGTFFGSRTKQHDSVGYLVDGRELYLLVAHRVRTAAQHVIDLDTSHKRVGGEIGLELAIG